MDYIDWFSHTIKNLAERGDADSLSTCYNYLQEFTTPVRVNTNRSLRFVCYFCNMAISVEALQCPHCGGTTRYNKAER